MASRPCRVCGDAGHVDLDNHTLTQVCSKCKDPATAGRLHFGRNPNDKNAPWSRFEPDGSQHVCGVNKQPESFKQPTDRGTDAPAEYQPDLTAITDRVKYLDDEVAIVKAQLHNGTAKIEAVHDFFQELPKRTDFQTMLATQQDIEQRFHALTQARPVSITVPQRATVNVGHEHYMFPNLVTITTATQGVGVPFLSGYPGSRKTSIVMTLAKALNVPVRGVIPVGMQTSKADLIGYNHAGGGYVTTALREAYEHGGIVLIDEIDAGNSNVLTIINGVLANEFAGFPDKMVQRHKDFFPIVSGNTLGMGADMLFVGRNQLDAASLDRFVTVPFDTDWTWVSKTLGRAAYLGQSTMYPDPDPNGRPDNDPILDRWAELVMQTHKITVANKIRAIVGWRAAINGELLLKAGVDFDLVEFACIRNRFSVTDWQIVQSQMGQGVEEEADDYLTDEVLEEASV